MQILQFGFFLKSSRNGRISSAHIPESERIVKKKKKHCLSTLNLSPACLPPWTNKTINTMSAVFLSSYCCLRNTDVRHFPCIYCPYVRPWGQILKKMFLIALSFHLQCKLSHLSQASYWYQYTIINGLKYANIQTWTYNPSQSQKNPTLNKIKNPPLSGKEMLVMRNRRVLQH